MMKRMLKQQFLFLFCLLSFSIQLFAQNTDYWFKPIHLLGKEFKGEIEGISSGISNSESNLEQEKKDKLFVDINEFVISRFLHSGMIYTSCRATDYLNAIAGKLLNNQPELLKKLNFYLVYTSDVNAFTFNNGMIFVNVGLLARLKNEAQLAFILAHEIQHFKMHHILDQYRNIKYEDEAMSKDEFEQVRILNARFSQKQELEADKEGLILYLNAGYSLEEAEQIFTVFNKANLQIENLNIPRSFFEGTYFKIPEVLYSDSNISEVLSEETFDSLSSHPAIEQRRTLVHELGIKINSLGKKWLVNEKDMQAIVDASYYLNASILIKERDFLASLYNTACLLEQYPNDEHLISLKLKALYYIQLYFNEGHNRRVIQKTQSVSGNYSKFHTLFKKISKQDMNGLVLRQAWSLAGALPQNDEIRFFRNAITKNFRIKMNVDVSYFKTSYDDSLVKISYLMVDRDTLSTPKKGSLKKKLVRQTDVLAQFSMPDYVSDTTFLRVFGNVLNVSPLVNNGVQDKKRAKGFHTNRLLVLDISNIILDSKTGDNLVKEDMREYDFFLKDLVNEMAQLNQMELTIFNPLQLNEADTQLFLERNLLERWKEERLVNLEINPLLPSEYAALRKLANKYNTPYVAIADNFTLTHNERAGEAIFMLLISLPNPLAFANTFYLLRSNRNYSGFEFKVFNIETGTIEYQNNKFFRSPAAKDYLKAEYYSIFNEIKQ